MPAPLSRTAARSVRVLGPAFLAASALLGCEGAEPDATEETVEVLAATLPGGGDITEVTAIGNGCPEGSWSAVPSADGKSVTLKLDAFEGQASGTESKVSRDCTLAIKLRGGEQLSYAPSTVEVIGLASGSAHYTHALSWEGRPAEKREHTVNEGGVIGFTRLHGDLWSPCGGPQTLLLRTEVGVEASRSVPAQTFSLDQTELTFAVRRCDQPPPAPPSAPSVKVNAVSAFGGGCLGSTSRVVASPDGQSFRVDFDALRSSFEPPGELASTDCRVMLDVDAPDGYTYAIESFVIDGRGKLERGATGYLDAHASVLGRGPKTRRNGQIIEAEKRFDGPVAEDFSFAGAFTRDDLDFAPCGSERPVSLSLGLGVRGAPAASLTVSSLRDVKFALKRCTSR